MKRFLNKSRVALFALIAISAILFTGCTKDKEYILKQEDIKISSPANGFSAKAGQLLKVTIESISDEGVSYKWLLDGIVIADTKNLEYMTEVAGDYKLVLEASKGVFSYKYEFDVTVVFDKVTPPATGATAYITEVIDFMPGIGQFTNKMPAYVEGDTQEKMNEKVLAAIGNNKRTMITLGGYGGYVVVGFDHTIENVAGKRDFRVLGNAFYMNQSSSNLDGGSCEPGIIMVAYDINNNGKPDENEWYEIAGSSHEDVTKEPWYARAKDGGNNMNFYTNYEMTYHRPAKEPETDQEKKEYIRWEDNKGNSGYKVKNSFHRQCYFPLWAKGDKLVFKGSCLPQNTVKEENMLVQYKFLYGYADNDKNSEDGSAIDISWAVNSKGQKVNLPGVDFIKIYTGVNQENGAMGETSTEVTGVEDLHILKEDINTRK